MRRRMTKRQEIDRLRGRLTARQLEVLRKDNPFRRERNALVRKLWVQGVKIPLMAEISGMSKSTVQRIAGGKPFKHEKRTRNLRPKGAGDGVQANQGNGAGAVGGPDPGVCGAVGMDRVEDLSGDLKKENGDGNE